MTDYSPEYGRLGIAGPAFVIEQCLPLYAVQLADNRDAAIMAELAAGTAAGLGRATLAPITLATIGLESAEVSRIARELRTGITVEEHAPEHYVLQTIDARLDAVQNAGRDGRAWEC